MRRRANNADKTKGLQNAVLSWFADHGRDFPWRETSNPFHIFVAEVLLRQTQATRLAKPYTDLIEKYPSAHALSQANIEELRTWFKSIGLIKRADYLVQAANILVKKYGGRVPDELDDLMNLPGIGMYSARAILCLAFNKPFPMVDESSGRLLRRVFNESSIEPAYSDTGLLQLASTLLRKSSSRELNLGLIDIAAVHCRVKNPRCTPCPLVNVCIYGQRNPTRAERRC